MSLNVLIVDDSDVIRSMISRTLQLSGISLGTIHEASNGREALEVIDESWVDIVLADLNMPVMDGREMVESLRRDAATADIPIVVVSTEGSAERVEALLASGVAAWVRKPFTPEEIRDVVASVSRRLTARVSPSLVDEVFTSVLQRFAFVFPETVEGELPVPSEEIVCARIGCTGAVTGAMTLAAPMSLCRELAANVMGIEAADAEAAHGGPDTLGELLNMTCGHLSTEVESDSGTDLSPPEVTRVDGADWEAMVADPGVRRYEIEGRHALLAAMVRVG